MRVCSVPGCPELYGDGKSRCPTHRKEADRARGTTSERGYSTRGHRAFRNDVLMRDPICALCHAAQSTVADHYPLSRKQLIEHGMDPDNPDAGRGLCKKCHDTETATNQPGGWHT